MEQIIRKDGRLYYGDRQCADVDGAYRLFRDEYNASVGRVAFKRLSRLGSRKERVHGRGIVFVESPVNPCVDHVAIPIRLLGIVSGSYCWMLGGWDVPRGVGDDEFDRWLDWALSRGSGALRAVRSRYKRKPKSKQETYGRKETESRE